MNSNDGRIYETERTVGDTYRAATIGGRPMTEDARAREEDGGDEDHLADVPAGSGCTEIWEHLSERREAAGSDD